MNPNTTQLKILQVIDEGYESAREIDDVLDLEPYAIDFHLNALVQNGYLKGKRETITFDHPGGEPRFFDVQLTAEGKMAIHQPEALVNQDNDDERRILQLIQYQPGLGESEIAKHLDLPIDLVVVILDAMEQADYLKLIRHWPIGLVGEKVRSDIQLTPRGRVALNHPEKLQSLSNSGFNHNQDNSITIKDSSVNLNGVAPGGSVSIQGTIDNTINTIDQLSDSLQTEQLKELLTQLQDAIATEPNLPDENKAEALEEVQALAKAGQNPGDGAMKKLAKRSMRTLKGIADELPTATRLVEGLNKLLPAIAALFGL